MTQFDGRNQSSTAIGLRLVTEEKRRHQENKAKGQNDNAASRRRHCLLLFGSSVQARFSFVKELIFMNIDVEC